MERTTREQGLPATVTNLAVIEKVVILLSAGRDTRPGR